MCPYLVPLCLCLSCSSITSFNPESRRGQWIFPILPETEWLIGWKEEKSSVFFSFCSVCLLWSKGYSSRGRVTWIWQHQTGKVTHTFILLKLLAWLCAPEILRQQPSPLCQTHTHTLFLPVSEKKLAVKQWAHSDSKIKSLSEVEKEHHSQWMFSKDHDLAVGKRAAAHWLKRGCLTTLFSLFFSF